LISARRIPSRPPTHVIDRQNFEIGLRKAVYEVDTIETCCTKSLSRSGRWLDRQNTASDAGVVLCRSETLLPPYGGLVDDYRGGSNVRRPSLVCGDRWQSCSRSQHDGDARYQRHQFKYQHAQQRPPGPLRATQDHQSTTKRPVGFLVTPHALKLLERPISVSTPETRWPSGPGTADCAGDETDGRLQPIPKVGWTV